MQSASANFGASSKPTAKESLISLDSLESGRWLLQCTSKCANPFDETFHLSAHAWPCLRNQHIDSTFGFKILLSQYSP
jgi:hypothetical protein